MVSIALRGLGAIPRGAGIEDSDNDVTEQDDLAAWFDVASMDAAKMNGAPGLNLAVMPPQASGGLVAPTAEAPGQRCFATRQPCVCEMNELCHQMLQKHRLIADDLRQISANLGRIADDFAQMRADSGHMESNFRQTSTDMGQTKADVGQVKADVEQMRADVGQMQGAIADLPQVQQASRQMQGPQITQNASETAPTSLR